MGGSAALVTSLLNYLGSIREEAAEADDSSKDDDTLYLNLRNKKASMAGSLAIAGGAMGALGAYALVRKLYQDMKKKEVQSRLDQAQQGYLDVLDVEKTAAVNKPMGWGEGLFSAPGAAALLLAIASGAVTNQALKKTFPIKKSPDRRNPRKVVIRRERPEEDEQEKTANAKELVYQILIHTKSAALRDFQDLIHGIGQGRRNEISSGLMEFGLGATHNMVKGASLNVMDPRRSTMACGIAARDPLMGPSLDVLAAAEFNDHFPSAVKIAAALPEDVQDNLIKIASIVAQAFRHDIMEVEEDLDKSAGLGTFVTADMLNDFLTKKNEEEPLEENLNSSDSESSQEDKTSIQGADPTSNTFKNDNKDIIDAALAPNG